MIDNPLRVCGRGDSPGGGAGGGRQGWSASIFGAALEGTPRGQMPEEGWLSKGAIACRSSGIHITGRTATKSRPRITCSHQRANRSPREIFTEWSGQPIRHLLPSLSRGGGKAAARRQPPTAATGSARSPTSRGSGLRLHCFLANWVRSGHGPLVGGTWAPGTARLLPPVPRAPRTRS